MKNKKVILIAIAFIIVLGTFIYMKITNNIKVEVFNVKTQHVIDSFEEKGTVKIGEPIDIISKISGDVEEIFVSENSYVKKGDVIVKIDSKDYEYEKRIHSNNIEAYYAQINDILNTEKIDKKDISSSIVELKVQLEGYKINKEQSEISKISSSTPEEYLESLKLDVDVAQNEYDYMEKTYESQKDLYELNVISNNELLQTENSWLKAKNNLKNMQLKYNQSVEKLEELKALGIDENNLNLRFFEGQYNDIDYIIKATQLKIDSLKEKLNNDYTSDNVKRINALIDVEKIAIEQIDERINDCVIKAPATGYIINCLFDKASAITQGQNIGTIKSNSNFMVYADILTTYTPYLKENDEVWLIQKLKSKDKMYKGVITEIYSFAIDSYSSLGLKEQRVRVIVDIRDEEVNLYDGYEVDVKFNIYNGENKLIIPNSSVFEIDDEDYVFKVKNGKAILSQVDVEYKTNIETVISSGIEENDIIIYDSNIEGLKNETKVLELQVNNNK